VGAEAREERPPPASRRLRGERGDRFDFRWPPIVQNRLRAIDDEALRLLRADALGRGFAPFGQERRTMLYAVRIGGQQVHEPLIEHLLAEVARLLAEAAREAARRHLHPHAALHERDEHVVVPPDPREPFGMRQHRRVARGGEFEHRFGEPRRRHVVRRLQQKVAAPCERRCRARAQAPEQFGREVRIGAERQAKVDLPRRRGGAAAPSRAA
jgi:hypothetical protein